MQQSHLAGRIGLAVICATLLTLTACGGGGGSGSGSGGGGDTAAPTATITFPPPQSLSSAGTITVRGTASDASEITVVRVNGVDATSSDGFATWSATVPLSAGPNDLMVETGDIALNEDSAAAQATVERQALWQSPFDAVLDSANNRAVVVDYSGDALFAVDLATGNRTVVSDNSNGNGTNFSWPQSLAMDGANNRALVVDPGLNALLAVDLATGDRTVVSDSSNGGGIEFRAPVSVGLDSANDRALVVENVSRGGNISALFAVDLDTGERTVMSGSENGGGVGFGTPNSVVLDNENDRALVLDSGLDALLAVDLATGDRSVVSDDETGNGEGLRIPQLMVLDSAQDRALVFDNGHTALLAVDLTTGDRTVVADSSTGSGPDFRFSRAMVLDSAGNRVLGVDFALDALLAVDLDTGDRSVVSEIGIGSGEGFVYPGSVVSGNSDNQALVLVGGEDTEDNALVAVDLATGNRTILSDSNTGSGIEFSRPSALALDSANNRALVMDGGYSGLDALLAVDLATGDRTVVSDSSTGTGDEFELPASVALDRANNRALVIEASDEHRDGLDALLAVDLDSGDRTVVSDSSNGEGVDFDDPRSVVLDSAEDQALVVDRGLDALFTVDLATGDRTIVSDSSNGEGDNFDDPRAVVMDSAEDQALVVDAGLGALLAVDLATGDRTVVSDSSTGNGVAFGFPNSVVPGSTANVALVADSGTPRALLMVDLVFGDRVIVSK